MVQASKYLRMQPQTGCKADKHYDTNIWTWYGKIVIKKRLTLIKKK